MHERTPVPALQVSEVARGTIWRVYDRLVDPIAVCLLGVVAGVALGAGLYWFIQRSRAAKQAEAATSPPSPADLIGLLDSVVVWVTEHDELIAASPRAEALGLVSGTRVMHPTMLEAIRQARMDRTGIDTLISINRGLRLSVELSGHAEPADDQSVFLVAVDNAPEERVNVAAHDFVANTSHELKTPVGAISLLAEALATHPQDSQMVQRFSTKILSETERLAELVSQLIALSRLQSADPLLSAEDIDLEDLVNHVVDRFGALSDQRGVTISVAGDPDLNLHADSEQIATALSNLVHNAIAYSAQNARVTVSTRRAQRDGVDVIDMAVTDNGIGISDDDQTRVFERFFRVDPARSRDSGGTGLGLPIVRHIAQAHGGDVTVWSQPGRGSTFTMWIPLREDIEA